MNLVLFKKDKHFWTIDEAEEGADKEDNHDNFSVFTDAAGSDDYNVVYLCLCHCQTVQSPELINLNLI